MPTTAHMLHASLVSSPFLQIRLAASLVLHTAAACPVFDRRSVRAHLQPPAQLAIMLSQLSLNLASMQVWCSDNKQRVQLLCCCCPLSTLAPRLVRAVNRRQGSRSFEIRAMAHIMRRCLILCAHRLWTGHQTQNSQQRTGLKRRLKLQHH